MEARMPMIARALCVAALFSLLNGAALAGGLWGGALSGAGGALQDSADQDLLQQQALERMQRQHDLEMERLRYEHELRMREIQTQRQAQQAPAASVQQPVDWSQFRPVAPPADAR